jgi:glycosyltransferase involved in cell wall biosynthesis
VDIGICIPTRNQSGLITDALRSAFAQTVAPCDVVVSDDAGTDDTRAVVEAFGKTLPLEKQKRLRYDRSSQQLNIGGNFDRAVRLAQGEFVVKLDSDDILEPEFIEHLAAQLQANPRTGWAHCNVMNIHPDGAPIALAHTRKRSGFYSSEAALAPYLKHNDTCHCVLIRKSAYLSVGGYRPEMKTCEDWLLWLEMLMAGWGYVFDERPLARMRKYPNRTELMSRRRLAFIESARFMILQVDNRFRTQPPAKIGLSADEALARFHGATANLCVSSGCEEGDPVVRRALFEAAMEFRPSLKNRLWLALGSPLPAAVTGFASRVAGMPRNLARFILRFSRARLQPGG